MAAKDIFGGINFGGIIGGWQPILMPATTMPQPLASGLDVALEGYVGMSFSPVFILGQQLVNGINYALIADGTMVTNPPVKKTVILIINVPFSIGKAQDGTGSKIVRVIDADNADVPEDIALLFNEAKVRLLGTDHKLIAFIGGQVTNGMTYHFICQSTPVRPGATPYATLAKLWVKPDGVCEVTFDRIPKR